jgi:hypothetical protein
MKYEHLARRWWRNQAESTIDAQLAPSRSWVRTEIRVDNLARDPGSLAKIVEALVATAPSKDDLPYVGTSVLETSSFVLGRTTLDIFENSKVPDEQRRHVLRGFAHPLDG